MPTWNDDGEMYSWSFEWGCVDPDHGIECGVKKCTAKAKYPEIKNDKLNRICKQLVDQLENEGFISYGYLYNALGIKMPDESYRYKFWLGSRRLWKASIQEEIKKSKVSLEGMRANAKGFSKQEQHFLELVQREISKADMMEKKIDILEELVK